MGVDHVGPPAVHQRSRVPGRRGVEPVSVVVLFDPSRGADPVHGHAVDDLGPRRSVDQAEPDRAREHCDLVTARDDVAGDALQLQRGTAREVGRVVGGHVEDAHRGSGTVPGTG
jgi:hypothetical protein